MEEGWDEGGVDSGDGIGNDGAGGAEPENDALREEPWDGKLDGETIELKEDEE